MSMSPKVCLLCAYCGWYCFLWYNAVIAFSSQPERAINTELRPELSNLEAVRSGKPVPISISYFLNACSVGIRELMRGLATLPQRCIREPLVVRDRDGRPQEEPWQCTASVCVAGVYCWEILGLADPLNVIFCLSCQFILVFSCMYSLCIVS